MKTYEEFIDEVVTEEYKRINPVAMNIHKNAAKEYAKSWVHEFALQTFHHLDARGYNDILTQLEPRIKDLIDAQ